MPTFRFFLASSLLPLALLAADPAHADPPAPAAPTASAAAGPTSAPAAPAPSPSPAAAPAASASASAPPAASASAPPAASASAPPAASAAPEPEPAAPSSSAPPSSGVPPLRLQDAVVGGIGIASILVGGILMGSAAGIQAGIRADAPKDPNGDLVCSRTSSLPDADPTRRATCDDLRSRASLGSSLGNAGIGFVVGGGVIVAAAAAYWLTSPAAPPARSARLVPAVGPGGGGLFLIGTF